MMFSKTSMRALGAVCSLGATLWIAPSSSAQLIHRYSFDADASDSVGSADGTILGNGYVAGGRVELDGLPETYVELPGGVISGLTNVTVEAWVDIYPNLGWARLFDFGDTNPDSGNGRNYVMFTPHSGATDIRASISDADPGYNHEEVVTGPGVLDNLGLTHVAVVFAPPFAAVYTNGVLLSSRNDLTIPLTAVDNVYSYIGKAVYNPDPTLFGAVDEFRIYDRALMPEEVLGSYASGTETPGMDPGAVTAIALQLPSSLIQGGIEQPVVRGTFANAGEVSLRGFSDVEVASSDSNVIAVNADGTLRAVAPGTAEISVSYGGQVATQEVSVVLAEAVLKHRYSFNTEGEANDVVGGADGFPMGAVVTGGEAQFDGISSYIDLPNGLISSMTNITIETWATWSGEGGTWQRILDFGDNEFGEESQGNGWSYIFISPNGGNGIRFTAKAGNGQPETPVLDSGSAAPVGEEVYVAVVYSPATRTAELYVDGILVASGEATTPLATINDVNVWLGRSNFPDPYFSGSINELRIHEGALSAEQIAVSAAAGPNTLVEDAGDLESLTLNVPDALTIGALPPQLTLSGNYEAVSGVNILGFEGVEVESTDTNVVRIGSDGQLRAWEAGTAQIIARYNGLSATGTVTTAFAAGRTEPELIHRYSFNSDANPVLVEDLVGNADGTILGGATYEDGQLNLNGTDGYVDLPNGLISSLTDATFEGWITWRGGADWQRIFDFGSNIVGEDSQGEGETGIFLSPRAGATGAIRFSTRVEPPPAGEPVTIDAAVAAPENEELHFAVSYDVTTGTARLYLDGELVGIVPNTTPLNLMNDVNVWLGRSNWPDAAFNGSFNEFRIYSGALSGPEVQASFNAGPNSLPGEGGDELPALSVTRTGDALQISWEATAGVTLQVTETLGVDANWTAVTEAVTTNGTTASVEVPYTGEQAFFRLAR